MPRSQGIGRTGKKHKKSATHNIHRQPKATIEPTVATEAPEPPAAPHNEPEMEVEPAAPDQTANRLLLMTAEHEAAMAALRRNLAAEQGGAESKEEIEIKEETAVLTWYDDPFIGSTVRDAFNQFQHEYAKGRGREFEAAARTRAMMFFPFERTAGWQQDRFSAYEGIVPLVAAATQKNPRFRGRIPASRWS